MMMRTIILSVVLGLFFISCSRDNDEVVNNKGSKMLEKQEKKEEKILVTEITEEIDGKRVGNSIYSYDGDKLKKIESKSESTGNSSTITYQYNGDLIKSSNEIDSKGRTENIEYTYNSEGQLEKSVSTEKWNKDEIIKTKNYIYKEGGVIIVNVEKLIKSNNGEKERKTSDMYTYTYTDGQLTKLVEKNVNDEITKSFEYDGKNSPLMNIKGISALAIEFFDRGNSIIGSTKNNLKTLTISVNGKGGEYKSVIHYEYNAYNYPTKITSAGRQVYVLTYNK